MAPLVSNAAGDQLSITATRVGTIGGGYTTLWGTGNGWLYINCAVDGYAYGGQQYMPICANISLTDASGGYPGTNNTFTTNVFDACGTNIIAYTSYDWYNTGDTAHFRPGWIANPVPVPTNACFGQWTATYSYSQTFTDSQVLTATASTTFNATRTLSEALSNANPQAPLQGGPIAPAEQLGGCACGTTQTDGQATSHPIDTGTGDFWHSFSDLTIPGRGPALSLTRTYNSLQAANDSPFGYGWTDSYGMSLTLGSSTTVVNQENGSQVTFTSNGTGSWTAPPRAAAVLANNSDGTWTYTRRARDIVTFDSSGRLMAIGDLNGNRTTITHPSGTQMVVTDANGRSLTFTLSGGHVTTVANTASPSQSAQYTYDASGNLTDVVDLGGGHWQFTYDGSHRMLTMRSPRYYGDTSTTPSPVVTNHYDSAGRVDWQSDQLGRKTSFDYMSVPGATLITDPAGGITLDEYTTGLLTGHLVGYGTSTLAATYYRYDPATAKRSLLIDADGNTSRTTYDALGDPLTVTDGLGNQTVNSYDSLGDLLQTTEPVYIAGQHPTTTYTYDAAGNRLTEVSPLITASGGQTDTATTTYHHGDPNHPEDITSVTNPNGLTTTTTYDSFGDVTSITDAAGDKTTYSYDTARGLRTSKVSPRGNVTGGNPAAYTTTYEYNAYGRLTVTKDPMWTSSAPTLHETAIGYDADGNQTTTTDGAGHTTTFTFDAAGETTDVRQGASAATHRDYFPNGLLKDQVDGNGSTTSYAYDSAGHVTTKTDPLGRVTHYTYDANANLLSVTDALGRVTTTGYNADNKPTSTDYSDGTPNVTSVGYDADGQRTSETIGTTTATWSFDSLHRLIANTNTTGATVAYGYDIGGRQTSVTYPGTVGTVNRTYDNANHVHTITDWNNGATTYAYDADGNITAEAYPNGTTSTFSYDADDKTSTIAAAKNATPTSPYASFNYTRDGSEAVTGTTSTGVPSDNHSFTYDAATRLSKVDVASYTYDQADNLTTQSNGTQQIFDKASELTATTSKPAISLVGTAAGGVSASSNVTLSLPAGTTVDDQVILAVTYPYGKTVNTPAGYSVIGTYGSGTKNNTSAALAVFRHVVYSGETSVAVTFSAKMAATVTATVYRNLHPTFPIDVSVAAAATPGTSLGFQSLTTTGTNDRLVMIAGANGSAGTWLSGSGLTTEVQKTGGSTDQAVADLALGTPGQGQSTYAQHSTSTQLVGVLLALKQAQVSYGYDADGERNYVSDLVGNGTPMSYDQASRLTMIGSGAATYTYGADSLRASTTVGGVTTNFTWDVSSGLPALLVSGATAYVYGPDGTPIEQVNGATTTFLQHDQLGSTRVLTDNAGNVTATYTFGPYGNLLAKTGTGDTALRWNGQYQDAESGLYYLRGRYYDPATAQFITVDPLVAQTGSPYGYVYDNPLNAADPTGLGCGWLSPQDCVGDALNAVGSVVSGGLDAIGGLSSATLGALNDAANATVKALGDAANALGDAANAIASGAISVADYIAAHPGQVVVIVAGVVAIVAASVLTVGLADALVASGAALYEEGTVAGTLEAAELASHAPFVLAPGLTVGGLGATGVYLGTKSLLSGGSTACP